MMSKTCTCCSQTFYAIKIEDFAKHFHKAKVGKFGFTARCKKCRFENETVPNRDKRAEYDRARRKTTELEEKSCIVCNKMFTPVREEINCCSKECTKFKKKVHNKLYMRNGYREILNQKRHKEMDRDNHKKHYTVAEIDYLTQRLDKEPKRLAIRLKRSTNAVRNKMAQLRAKVGYILEIKR